MIAHELLPQKPLVKKGKSLHEPVHKKIPVHPTERRITARVKRREANVKLKLVVARPAPKAAIDDADQIVLTPSRAVFRKGLTRKSKKGANEVFRRAM